MGLASWIDYVLCVPGAYRESGRKMRKKLLAAMLACLVQSAQSATPVHVSGMEGWLINTSFSYSASPDSNPAQLAFESSQPSLGVIGDVDSPYLAAKTAGLWLSVRADMNSIASSGDGDSFTQSFAARGTFALNVLDSDKFGHLLAAEIDQGAVRVDLLTRRTVVEFHLVSLTSEAFYLTGLPATLRLVGELDSSTDWSVTRGAQLGNCADHSYKAACLPGEQFLDDFALKALGPNRSWSVSSEAFAAAVPELSSTTLLLLGGSGLWVAARRRRPTGGV